MLNESSEWYTFCCANGQSDIDVTLGYQLNEEYVYE